MPCTDHPLQHSATGMTIQSCTKCRAIIEELTFRANHLVMRKVLMKNAEV